MNATASVGSEAGKVVPSLPRGVRLRFDEVRRQWFLLGPERVFEPDETALEILRRVDGARSIDAIAGELAAVFDADAGEIAGDVATFLRDLADQRMIDL